MIVFISGKVVEQAIFITSTDEYGPTRRYYEYRGGVIICRNNYALEQFKNRKVDAVTGWSQTYAGFTLDESKVGQLQPRITLYRPIERRWPAPDLNHEIDKIKQRISEL